MSGAAPAARAVELERRYLSSVFADLCAIESPSGRERACARRVAQELDALGIALEEDGAGPRVGGDCGNMLARLPAPGTTSGASLMLCAHLDTVPPTAPLAPVLEEGAWQNANDGILGADNKAAVAVLLALARAVRRLDLPVALELLFTVGEERSLAGASAFDASVLRSPFGYVFDHATAIGGIVTSSPTHFRIEAELRGAAAHAGIRPEEGRSAIVAAARAIASMRLGRLDEETTANVGMISGGSAINVVPEHASVLAEVRSLEEPRAEAVVAEIVDRIEDAANLPECECDADISVQRMFAGYTLPRGEAAVLTAEAALRDCGFEPRPVRSGGGSDANALISKGFHAVNLANGTEHPHEPRERVSVAALEGMLDVALALVSRVAQGDGEGEGGVAAGGGGDAPTDGGPGV